MKDQREHQISDKENRKHIAALARDSEPSTSDGALPPEYWESLGGTIRHMETIYAGGKYGASELGERISRLIECYEIGASVLTLVDNGENTHEE